MAARRRGSPAATIPRSTLVYWPTGNPGKEYNGDDRKGDNLYANSILALDRKTGKLQWYYQFTPHDLWDWDATQTSVLIDAEWQGQPRRLMLHAARNGFFYVFDRENGKLLLAKPFVRNLTWASGIGADGRPIKLPNQEPTPAGHEGVSVAGRRDQLVLAVLQSGDRALLRADVREVQHLHEERAGRRGRAARRTSAGRSARRRIRSRSGSCKAIDIRTGAIEWELPQPGPAQSWGGTLATATGLVIFGEEGGGLMAADAVTGKPLWIFQTNQIVEGVADDLHVRRPAVRGGGGGIQHHRAGDPRLT